MDKQLTKCLFLFLFLFCIFQLFGGPSNPTVVSGDVKITPSQLVSKSNRSIVEWEDFSIDLLETFHCQLPDATSSLLNRVVGPLSSQILGALGSNGQIILINPNGIVIGNQGIIDVGSFMASTLDVTDRSFLKGEELLFQGDSEEWIHHHGLIKARSGDLFLIGHNIVEQGAMVVEEGAVHLACGKEVLVRPHESECIVISTGRGGILQSEGEIQAQKIILQSNQSPYGLAINQEGLEEGVYVEIEGKTTVSGSLVASQGGVINVLGDGVKVLETAQLFAPEGTIRVGGGYKGEDGRFTNAKKTTVFEGASLDVSSTDHGDGGSVIIWSDELTGCFGTICACGGPNGGDGGFIEISGGGGYYTNLRTNTKAPNGKVGSLRIDPSDITISTAVTSGGSFVGGVFDPAGASANVNIGDLNTALVTSNVLITTSGGVGGTGDITFSSAGGTTAITSPGNDLTLNADNDISFERDTSLTDTVGTASFIFTADQNIANTGGDFVTCTGANAFTWTATNGSILVNDDMTFTDVDNVTFTAGTTITNNGGDTVSHTGVGSFSWTAGGDITVGETITVTGPGTVSFTSTGGSITINDPIAVSGSSSFTITANNDIDINDLVTASGGSTSFIVEATTGGITYGADVTSDAITTIFRAPGGTSDIVFDGGGDYFGNPTSSGTVTFSAGQDINIDVDMDFEDTSGSENVSFIFTAGRNFINQPPDSIDIINVGSVSITAANNVTIQDPLAITGATNSVTVEATGGEITINGNLRSDALTTLFSAPTVGTGNITFSSAGGTITSSPSTSGATFTFSAGNDIIQNDDLTFTDLTGARNVSFILTAGNDIQNNPSFSSFYINAASVLWTAGQDIEINDPFTANGVTTVSLTATSGDIRILDTIDTNATTTSLTSGGDILVQNQVEVNQGGGGDLNVTAGNDILVGGAGVTIPTRLGTRIGTLTLNAARDITLTPGTGANDFAQIGFDATIISSDIDITVGRNLTLTGNALANNIALIGHGGDTPAGGTLSGDIIFRSIGGDVTLTGGTATDSFAQIGHTGGSNLVSISGDIRGPTAGSPAVVNGSLTLTGGSGDSTYALVGHGGQTSTNADTYSGNIDVQAQDITLTAGSNTDTFAAIGFYAINSGINTVTVSSGSEVHVVSDNALTLQGGTGTRANTAIGARIPITATGIGDVTLSAVEVSTGSGNDLSLLGGSNEAILGALVDSGTARTTSTSISSGNDLRITSESGIARIVDGEGAVAGSSMTVNAEGLIELTSGTGIASIDAIDTLTLSAGTDLDLFDSATAVARIVSQNISSTTTITAETNLELTATNGTGAFIEVNDDTLIVRTNNGDIVVNEDTYIRNLAATPAESTLEVHSGGTLLVRDNGFIENGGTGKTTVETENLLLISNNSYIQGGGEVEVNTNNDLIILGGNGGEAYLTGAEVGVNSNNNILLLGESAANPAFIEATGGNLSVIAAKDLSISLFSRIENTHSGGSLTIVVDNQAPSPPVIGNGIFHLGVSGSVATAGGGPLRIFTARRSQNVILGTSNINGATFVPGTLYVDSATEVWNTYFPSVRGGVPYTFFYKDTNPVPPTPVTPVVPLIFELGPNALIGNYQLYYMLDRIDRFYDWKWDYFIEERFGGASKEWYVIPHEKYLKFPVSL